MLLSPRAEALQVNLVQGNCLCWSSGEGAYCADSQVDLPWWKRSSLVLREAGLREADPDPLGGAVLFPEDFQHWWAG